MSNEKAIQVLNKQIKEVEDAILNNKVDIADLFVKVHDFKPFFECDVDDFMAKMNEMDKMPPLVEKLRKNQGKLQTLVSSKTEIQRVYCEYAV